MKSKDRYYVAGAFVGSNNHVLLIHHDGKLTLPYRHVKRVEPLDMELALKQLQRLYDLDLQINQTSQWLDVLRLETELVCSDLFTTCIRRVSRMPTSHGSQCKMTWYNPASLDLGQVSELAQAVLSRLQAEVRKAA